MSKENDKRHRGRNQQQHNRTGPHPHSHQRTDDPHGASGRGHWPRVTSDQMNIIHSKAADTYSFQMHILQDRSVLLNTSHSRFNKAGITSSIYYNHKALRLEFNYKKEKNPAKPTNIWGLNNTLLNSWRITEEVRRGCRVHPETNDGNTAPRDLRRLHSQF